VYAGAVLGIKLISAILHADIDHLFYKFGRRRSSTVFHSGTQEKSFPGPKMAELETLGLLQPACRYIGIMSCTDHDCFKLNIITPVPDRVIYIQIHVRTGCLSN